MASSPQDRDSAKGGLETGPASGSSDAVGPVAEHAIAVFHAHAGQRTNHGTASLTGLDAAQPGFGGSIKST